MRNPKITLALALYLLGTSACTTMGDAGVLLAPQPANSPANIVLGVTSLTLLVGQLTQVQATVVDASGTTIAGAPISYTSADSTIAAVSSSGMVTPKKRATSSFRS